MEELNNRLVLKHWKIIFFSPEWCSEIIGPSTIVHVQRKLVLINLEDDHSSVTGAFILDETLFCAL